MPIPRVLKYDIVNVFVANGKSYSGNPLAVIYDGQDLSQQQCLVFGRQFNLSEITFPHSASADSSSYSVRIFTPGKELPFAGHPTLGTCFALLHTSLDPKKGQAVQYSKSGETLLRFPKQIASPFEPARISMRATKRFTTERLTKVVDLLLPTLGLPKESKSCIRFIRRASCGLPWQYVQLDSVETVKAVKTSGEALFAFSEALKESVDVENRQEPWLTGLSIFAIDSNGPEGDLSILARILFQQTPGGTMIEDPATGSAALGLGLVLHEEKLLSDSLKYVISQGTEIGQPSQLFGQVEVDDTGKAVAVHVAGDVVKVGGGEMVWPSE